MDVNNTRRVERTRVVMCCLTLLAAFAITVTVEAQDRARTDLDNLTRAFASFDVRDMNGTRWTAAGLRGRVVVLDFWATWCPPCWAEIPWLRRLHQDFDDERVQVIGVSLDTTNRRTFMSWLNQRRVDWPQVWDQRGYDSIIAARFGVDSLPVSILIAPDGRVVALNLRGARLLTAVEALLDEGDTKGEAGRR